MKLIILTCLVALAAADVSHLNTEKAARILAQEFEIDPLGNYKTSLETENGISQSEVGTLVNPNSENAALQVQGEASYTNPEGERVVLQYLANENGFQPQGSHLPTPPPIPIAIQRALEFIAANPPAQERE